MNRVDQETIQEKRPDPAGGEPSTWSPAGAWRRWGWPERGVVLAAVLLAAYCALQIVLLRFGRDQGIYAVVANAVLDGGMPYREAWDFKPPGIFVVYTLARGLLGRNEWGIRLVETAGFLSLIPSFAVLTRRYLGDIGPGILGGAFAVLIEAQLDFWHTAQPESFGGLLTVWALVLTIRDVPNGDLGRGFWGRLFGAGVLLGAAGLMKPHLVGTCAVVAVYTLWKLRRQGRPGGTQVAVLGTLAAGASASFAACLGWFAARGALGDLHQALFVFAPGYAATTWSRSSLVGFLYYGFQEWGTNLSSVVAIGMLLQIGLPRVRATERELFWVVISTAAIQVVGVALQSKFFQYHYGATLPLGALIAGMGFWKALAVAKRYETPGWAVLGAIAYVAFEGRAPVRDLAEPFSERAWERTKTLLTGDAAAREELAQRFSSVADVHYPSNVRVATWLTQHTSAQDTVFIWGFEPFIYDAANRKPASRFIYNVPQRVTWENDRSRRLLLDDLARSRPKAIVVEHNDVFPVVTGNWNDSSRSLASFPELQRIVDEDYEYATTIQDFDLYLRKD